MKTKFKEYYPYKDEEYKDLWQKSLFIFDTNVILNLYRYSEKTTSEFKSAIKNVEERIWLPYNVVMEFQKRRLDVISDQKKIYADFIVTIDKVKTELDNENRNPFISESLQNKFNNILNSVQKELKEKEIKYDQYITKDQTHIEISEIFNEKVGDNFSIEELDNIYKNGKIRYQNSIPPGYKDNDKPEPDKYGDLVIWHQIIEKAKKDKSHIIFITDDRKEDWWLQQSGKTLSPRPELLREFNQETEKFFYIYKPFQFLKYSNQYLGSKYKKETIDEVEHFNPKSFSDKPIKQQIIELIVITLNTENKLQRFIELIKSVGYQVTKNELANNEYQLIIHIPSIPDLERRFKEKYLSLLNEYDLELKDYKII